MSIVIDFILVAILLLCTWNGFKKGLILSIAGVVGLIIAFIVAHVVSSAYSYEFIPILDPIVGNMVDEAAAETTTEQDQGLYDDAYADNPEADESYVFSAELLRKLGVPERYAQEIVDEVLGTAENTSTAIRTAITSRLCELLAYALVFLIVFLLVVIIFSVISNVINLAFSLPGLRLLNDIGGTVLGFAKGFVYISLLAWVLSCVTILVSSETLRNTYVLSWLMEHNFLANLLGA